MILLHYREVWKYVNYPYLGLSESQQSAPEVNPQEPGRPSGVGNAPTLLDSQGAGRQQQGHRQGVDIKRALRQKDVFRENTGRRLHKGMQ